MHKNILICIFWLLFVGTEMLAMHSDGMGKTIKEWWKKLTHHHVEQQRQGSCLFLMLPEEIKFHIAQYLVFFDREFDTEFIKRTKKIQPIQEMRKGDINRSVHYLNGIITFSHSWLDDTTKVCLRNNNTQKTIPLGILDQLNKSIFSYSPNLLHVISSQSCCPRENRIVIFDVLKQKTIKKDYSCLHSVGDCIIPCSRIGNDCCAIAIANNGQLFAQIFDKIDAQQQHTYYLKIKNIENDKDPRCKSYKIPLNCIKSLAFNKQSTKLIVHSNNDQALFISLGSSQEHVQKSQKNLLDYFNQHRICKSWGE